MAKTQPFGPGTPGWEQPNSVPAERVKAWKEDGFVILRGLFTADQIARYNATVAAARAAIDDGKDASGYGGRVGQLHQKHPELLELPAHPEITQFVEWALGDKPVVMGSLQFEAGTQQAAHIDAWYFYPDPIWSMAGVWIALEDILPDAGPLFYIPGSHRQPFAHSDDLASGNPDLTARRLAARSGADRDATLAELERAAHADLKARVTAEPIAPALKAGDAVIWHSLLAHGGMPRANPALSRRSAVFHFFGRGARLLEYGQFMLYGQGELRDQPALVRPLRQYGQLPYHHTGSWVSYASDAQIHPVADPPSAFAVGNLAPKDTTLVRRIAAAYRNAMGAHVGAGTSMWTDFHDHKADVAKALADDDIDHASRLLRDPASTMFFYGFDSLFRDYAAHHSAEAQAGEASIFAADMRRLAQLVGPLDRFDFPNPFPREFGVVTDRGIASYRPLQAIHQAWRLQQLCARSALEIGGGLGRTAYYARRLGIRDYTIVDLPITGVAQAYFLGRALGGHAVRLHGERPWFDRWRIKLLPPEALPDRRFDVILNVDSLTEMDRGIAERYITYARDHCRTFVSINHESNNFTVAELLVAAGITAERAAYPMRDGYIEEIARF